METFQQQTKMKKIVYILLNLDLIIILFNLIIIQEEMLSMMVSWCVMQYILIHLLISSNDIDLMGGNEGGIIVRLNTMILTKVNVQSINNVALPERASNKFRGDAIRLFAVRACDDTHDEILETIFSRQELHYDELILEREVKSNDEDSEFNEKQF